MRSGTFVSTPLPPILSAGSTTRRRAWEMTQTQTQLSRISGTAQSTVLDIETGAVSVSLDMYLRLLEALGAELTVTDRPSDRDGG